MTQRETTFAGLLAVAGLLIIAGVAWYLPGTALIVGGVLLAGWSWLVLAGDEEPPTASEPPGEVSS